MPDLLTPMLLDESMNPELIMDINPLEEIRMPFQRLTGGASGISFVMMVKHGGFR